MAGHPLEALILLGLGVRSLSMAPAAIGPVKSAIISADLKSLEKIIEDCLERGEGSAKIRKRVGDWIKKNNIDVG